MAYENIQADRESQHESEETQSGNTQHLGVHICRADDTGSDQQGHDPQAHDDISDQPSEQVRHLSGGIQLHVDLGLSVEVFFQDALDEGRKLHRLVGSGVKFFAPSFEG